MMRPDERLLGFDAREMWRQEPYPWGLEWMEICCLRHDVEKVLSTDTHVWSSVFEWEDGQPPRGWVGCHAALWNSLPVMLTALAEARDESKPSQVVAVTVLLEFCDPAERKTWDDRLWGIEPERLEAGWTLLGYDVSDIWLLSGLSNCGYDPETVAEDRRTWTPHLNRFHLFDDVARADAFRAFSNARVTEHAPFFVYGVWQRTEPH